MGNLESLAKELLAAATRVKLASDRDDSATANQVIRALLPALYSYLESQGETIKDDDGVEPQSEEKL